MTEAELKELENRLSRENERLLRALKNIASPDPNDPSKLSWDPKFPQISDEDDRGGSAMEDNAEEVEEFDSTYEAEETLEARHRDVSLALEKLKDGSYGKCEKCGADIPFVRLKANPAARFDIEHAE